MTEIYDKLMPPGGLVKGSSNNVVPSTARHLDVHVISTAQGRSGPNRVTDDCNASASSHTPGPPLADISITKLLPS